MTAIEHEGNEDLLALLTPETGETDAAAGREEEHEAQESENTRGGGASRGGAVPPAIHAALRRERNELRDEIRALRTEVQSIRQGGGASGESDPYKDLRDMSDTELADYAGEGSKEAKRVREFRRHSEEEREERIADKTAQRLGRQTEDQDKAEAQRMFAGLAALNPWLDDSTSILGRTANAEYARLRTEGQTPKQALRGMIREIAPLVRSKGEKLVGLDRIDPEFVQQVTSGKRGTTSQRESVNLDDGLPGGRGSESGRAKPPSARSADPLALSKSLAGYSEAEIDKWAGEADE